MRIFIGCHEVANFLYHFSSAFRQLGHDVQTMVFNRNKYHPNNEYYDKVLSDDLSWFCSNPSKYLVYLYSPFAVNRYLEQIIDKTDIFIFLWSSLLPFNWDLPYLKERNKKIVVIFCGSDVRHSDPFLQEFPINREAWLKDFPLTSLTRKIRYIRNVELYADLILSVPDQAGLALRPYHHLKIPFTTERYKNFIPNNKVPKIIHCPTRPYIKGTDKFQAVLDRLRGEGIGFDYHVFRDRTHSEIIELLANADVVLDQLYLPGPGGLGFEAMSSGCVECSRHDPNEAIGWTPPVYQLSESNLYEEVKKILTDRDLRIQLAGEGRSYVEKNHNPKIIAQEILDLLNNSANTYHYYPDFYLKKYRPTKKISRSMLLKTKEVLLRVGCSHSVDLLSAIKRGVLPPMSSYEMNRVPRW